MKAIPKDARTRNIAKHSRNHCDHCSNTGYVIACTRTDTWPNPRTGKVTTAQAEELAPCPYCERGFTVEFPDPDKLAKDPGRITPPWDPESGYWQGRDTADIAPLAPHGPPLPLTENRRRIRNLAQQIGVVFGHQPDFATKDITG